MVVVGCRAFVFGVVGVYYFYGDEERVCWSWWWFGASGGSSGWGEQETEKVGEEGWTEGAISVNLVEVLWCASFLNS